MKARYVTPTTSLFYGAKVETDGGEEKEIGPFGNKLGPFVLRRVEKISLSLADARSQKSSQIKSD